jgi:hypothetical protein
MIGSAFRRSCKLSVILPNNDWYFLRSLPAKKRLAQHVEYGDDFNASQRCHDKGSYLLLPE